MSTRRSRGTTSTRKKQTVASRRRRKDSKDGFKVGSKVEITGYTTAQEKKLVGRKATVKNLEKNKRGKLRVKIDGLSKERLIAVEHCKLIEIENDKPNDDKNNSNDNNNNSKSGKIVKEGNRYFCIFNGKKSGPFNSKQMCENKLRKLRLKFEKKNEEQNNDNNVNKNNNNKKNSNIVKKPPRSLSKTNLERIDTMEMLLGGDTPPEASDSQQTMDTTSQKKPVPVNKEPVVKNPPVVPSVNNTFSGGLSTPPKKIKKKQMSRDSLLRIKNEEMKSDFEEFEIHTPNKLSISVIANTPLTELPPEPVLPPIEIRNSANDSSGSLEEKLMKKFTGGQEEPNKVEDSEEVIRANSLKDKVPLIRRNSKLSKLPSVRMSLTPSPERVPVLPAISPQSPNGKKANTKKKERRMSNLLEVDEFKITSKKRKKHVTISASIESISYPLPRMEDSISRSLTPRVVGVKDQKDRERPIENFGAAKYVKVDKPGKISVISTPGSTLAMPHEKSEFSQKWDGYMETFKDDIGPNSGIAMSSTEMKRKLKQDQLREISESLTPKSFEPVTREQTLSTTPQKDPFFDGSAPVNSNEPITISQHLNRTMTANNNNMMHLNRFQPHNLSNSSQNHVPINFGQYPNLTSQQKKDLAYLTSNGFSRQASVILVTEDITPIELIRFLHSGETIGALLELGELEQRSIRENLQAMGFEDQYNALADRLECNVILGVSSEQNQIDMYKHQIEKIKKDIMSNSDPELFDTFFDLQSKLNKALEQKQNPLSPVNEKMFASFEKLTRAAIKKASESSFSESSIRAGSVSESPQKAKENIRESALNHNKHGPRSLHGTKSDPTQQLQNLNFSTPQPVAPVAGHMRNASMPVQDIYGHFPQNNSHRAATMFQRHNTQSQPMHNPPYFDSYGQSRFHNRANTYTHMGFNASMVNPYDRQQSFPVHGHGMNQHFAPGVNMQMNNGQFAQPANATQNIHTHFQKSQLTREPTIHYDASKDCSLSDPAQKSAADEELLNLQNTATMISVCDYQGEEHMFQKDVDYYNTPKQSNVSTPHGAAVVRDGPEQTGDNETHRTSSPAKSAFRDPKNIKKPHRVGFDRNVEEPQTPEQPTFGPTRSRLSNLPTHLSADYAQTAAAYATGQPLQKCFTVVNILKELGTCDEEIRCQLINAMSTVGTPHLSREATSLVYQLEPDEQVEDVRHKLQQMKSNIQDLSIHIDNLSSSHDVLARLQEIYYEMMSDFRMVLAQSHGDFDRHKGPSKEALLNACDTLLPSNASVNYIAERLIKMNDDVRRYFLIETTVMDESARKSQVSVNTSVGPISNNLSALSVAPISPDLENMNPNALSMIGPCSDEESTSEFDSFVPEFENAQRRRMLQEGRETIQRADEEDIYPLVMQNFATEVSFIPPSDSDTALTPEDQRIMSPIIAAGCELLKEVLSPENPETPTYVKADGRKRSSESDQERWRAEIVHEKLKGMSPMEVKNLLLDSYDDMLYKSPNQFGFNQQIFENMIETGDQYREPLYSHQMETSQRTPTHHILPHFDPNKDHDEHNHSANAYPSKRQQNEDWALAHRETWKRGEKVMREFLSNSRRKQMLQKALVRTYSDEEINGDIFAGHDSKFTNIIRDIPEDHLKRTVVNGLGGKRKDLDNQHCREIASLESSVLKEQLLKNMSPENMYNDVYAGNDEFFGRPMCDGTGEGLQDQVTNEQLRRYQYKPNRAGQNNGINMQQPQTRFLNPNTNDAHIYSTNDATHDMFSDSSVDEESDSAPAMFVEMNNSVYEGPGHASNQHYVPGMTYNSSLHPDEPALPITPTENSNNYHVERLEYLNEPGSQAQQREGEVKNGAESQPFSRQNTELAQLPPIGDSPEEAKQKQNTDILKKTPEKKRKAQQFQRMPSLKVKKAQIVNTKVRPKKVEQTLIGKNTGIDSEKKAGTRPPQKMQQMPPIGGKKAGKRPPQKMQKMPPIGGKKAGKRPPQKMQTMPPIGGKKAGTRPPQKMQTMPPIGVKKAGTRPPQKMQTMPPIGGTRKINDSEKKSGTRKPQKFQTMPPIGGKKNSEKKSGSRKPQQFQEMPPIGGKNKTNNSEKKSGSRKPQQFQAMPPLKGKKNNNSEQKKVGKRKAQPLQDMPPIGGNGGQRKKIGQMAAPKGD